MSPLMPYSLNTAWSVGGDSVSTHAVQSEHSSGLRRETSISTHALQSDHTVVSGGRPVSPLMPYSLNTAVVCGGRPASPLMPYSLTTLWSVEGDQRLHSCLTV